MGVFLSFIVYCIIFTSGKYEDVKSKFELKFNQKKVDEPVDNWEYLDKPGQGFTSV